MKKIIFFVFPILLAVIIFAAITFFFSGEASGKGALQVTSIPPSDVYLNGKHIGKTPLCKCELPDMIATGQYTIRLVPTEQDLFPFEQKITIGKSLLTVVDRTFGVGATGQGSVISLSPLRGSKATTAFIISFPLGASISLDSNPSGQTPVTLNNMTDSDHEIVVAKEGYKDKILRIHTVSGYQLEAIVFLGVDLNASPSATPTVSPSPTPAQTTQKVLILTTPTGFLRVRSGPSLAATESGRVNPGDSLELVSEEEGWFEIKLPNGQTGWISAFYAKKQ